MWEVIYVHFYNWDRPFDLVLVVCDLIELIIETLLWTKDYFTFDTHTQHTCLMFNECLIHLFNCTCLNVMCVCSSIYGSNQKHFLSFYMYLEVIFITLCVHVLCLLSFYFLSMFYVEKQVSEFFGYSSWLLSRVASFGYSFWWLTQLRDPVMSLHRIVSQLTCDSSRDSPVVKRLKTAF